MCRKHSSADMHNKMPKVDVIKANHMKKLIGTMKFAVYAPFHAKESPFSSITVDSYEWASESAQRRRYDAVLETHPSTNSIVSMNW